MSQAGYTPIQLYHSTTAAATPSAGNLAAGELAVNITDGKLFYKDNGGVVRVLATAAGAAGDVVGPGSSTDNALVRFDGTTGKLVQNSAGVLDDSGNLSGIAALTTSGALTLNGGTANGVAYLNGSKVLTTGSALTFDGSTFGVAVSGSTDALRITQTGTGNAFVVEDSTSPDASPFVIDASGNTAVGSEIVATALSGSTPKFSVNGTTLATATQATTNWGNSATSPVCVLSKSRGGTTGVHTIVQSGDGLGAVAGLGSDGTNFVQSARIDFQVDGTPGTNDMPGRLVFSTTADGASTPTERMRIDSSGNVGIGTSSPVNLLTVQTAATGTTAGSNVIARLQSTASGRDATLQFSDNVANSSTISMVGGATVFRQNGTESARIDSSGNVGIGTSSPGTYSAKLAVVSTAADTRIAVIDDTSNGRGGYLRSNYSDAVVLGTTSGVRDLVFAPDNTERVRISTSGNLLVGTSTGLSGSTKLYVVGDSSANWITAVRDNRGDGSPVGGAMGFYRGATNVGGIQTSTTSTSYVTSSDYRLKENIQPMTGALAKVAALKPCTYKWKADGSDGEGFIAHELAEVVPQCVTGAKDAVDAEGNPRYQGIDTSFLVATLTAAIQELKAINDAQAETITALTARVAALESN